MASSMWGLLKKVKPKLSYGQIAKKYLDDIVAYLGSKKAAELNLNALVDMFTRYFQKADEDHSGDIDPEELHKALRELNVVVSAEDLKQYLAMVDVNRSNTLDYREFLDLMFLIKKIIDVPVPLPEDKKKKKKNPLGLRQNAVREKQRGSLDLRLEVLRAPDSITIVATAKGARKLLAMDYNGLSDPYCEIELLPKPKHVKSVVRSEVLKRTLAPRWLHGRAEFKLPRDELLSSYAVTFRVYDWDRITANDFIGSLTIPLLEVVEKPIDGWFILLSETRGATLFFPDREGDRPAPVHYVPLPSPSSIPALGVPVAAAAAADPTAVAAAAAVAAPVTATPDTIAVPVATPTATLGGSPMIRRNGRTGRPSLAIASVAAAQVAAMVIAEKVTLEDFEIVSLLGEGSFGRVFKAAYRHNQRTVALKIVKKTMISGDNEWHAAFDELGVLALQPPNNFVARVFAAFQNLHNLYFVMELLPGGELLNLVESWPDAFPKSMAEFYAAELICGVGFLHSKYMIHRDIKLQNVVLTETGHVKLVDFGLAKNLETIKVASTFCGTPTYLAPEIVERCSYDYGVDWWAIGVLIYEMLTRSTPFYGEDENSISRRISMVDVDYSPLHEQASIDLLRGLLNRDRNRRLGATGVASIKAMPFFTQPWDAVESLRIQPPHVPSLRPATAAVGALTMSPDPPSALSAAVQANFDQFYYRAVDF